MQHFPTPAHSRHATARHTLHQLTATSPRGDSNAMKNLNFTKPLHHGIKINYYPRTRYYVKNSIYIIPIT
jgi:hypothetical protein